MKDIFRRFFENKDRFIDKLDLTDDQKGELKAFFKDHPNYESKIDWNKKDLVYEDFKPVLALEGKSRNSIKKYGISGKAKIADLEEGTDFDIIKQTSSYTLYFVKTFKGSEVLAKPSTPPEGVTGKWCIAGRNYSPGTGDSHWRSYTSAGYWFFFIFTPRAKYALSFSVKNFDESGAEQITDSFLKCFTSEDKKLSARLWPESVKEAVKTLNDPSVLAMLRVQAANSQQQLEIEKARNTKAKKEEILSVITELSQGTVSSRYIQPMEDPSYKNTSLAGLHELNLWGTWFPSSQSLHSETMDDQGIYDFLDNLKIPALRLPDTVEAIGKDCFNYFKNLESINLSNSVKLIRNSAFRGSGLKAIIIPKTVKFLENNAFSECENLTTVKFEGSMNNDLLMPFPSGIFVGCKALKEVVLPANLPVIRHSDFYSCKSLEKIDLPDTVVKIETQAFAYCSSLKEFPKSKNLQVIEASAFQACSSLKKVILPPSVTSIGWNAFTECELNYLELPASLTTFSKNSLIGLKAKEIVYHGTQEAWESLIRKNTVPKTKYRDKSYYFQVEFWYDRYIKPVLRFITN